MHIQGVVHDLPAARKRIAGRVRDFYRINDVSDLLLCEKDFDSAREMCAKEAQIVLDSNRLTPNGLLRGVIYCLLTPLQKYAGQVKGYDAAIMNRSFEHDDLPEILRDAGVLFHEQKAKYIRKATFVLDNPGLAMLITDNIGNRKSEIALRQELITDISGLGLKTGSLLLRMCGAQHVVPIDSWMMEMLYFHGYPCEMPRSKVERERWETKDRTYKKYRKTGLTQSDYLRAEEFALDLARKYEVPGYVLQMAFWTKKSTYEK